jgi:hypothetical protein
LRDRPSHWHIEKHNDGVVIKLVGVTARINARDRESPFRATIANFEAELAARHQGLSDAG